MSPAQETRCNRGMTTLRTLLIVFGVVGVVLATWTARLIHWAMTATPAITVDYGQRFRELELVEQDSTAPNEFEAVQRVGALLHQFEVEIWEKYGEPSQADAPEGWDKRLLFPLDYLALDVDDAPELAKLIAREYMDKVLSSTVPDDLATIRQARLIARPVPTGQLLDVDISDLGRCRGAARFCRARARLALRAKDWNQFVESILDMRGLGDACGRDPIMMAHLVALAIDALAISDVTQAVANSELPPDVLKSLDRVLSPHPARRSLDVVLEGEFLVFLDMVQRTHDADGRLIPSALEQLKEPNRAVERSVLANLGGLTFPTADKVAGLVSRVNSKLRELAVLPRWKRHGSIEELVGITIPPKHLYTDSQLIAAGKAFNATDQWRASINATRLIIALERCRLARGRYPANLGELVPEFLPAVPDDPYSEKGFVYKPSGTPTIKGGYTLYSVGDDGEDNGGLRAEHEQDALMPAGKGTDFVFIPPASE